MATDARAGTGDDQLFDVAVVGYGPGAQCLTGLLARGGCRVVALERYPHLYNLPRAGHIDHEAMRLVQNIGDADRLEKTLWEVRGDYVWLNANRQLLMLQPALDTEPSVSGWFSDYSQWQPNLEAALDEGARAAGADVRLGREVISLTQEADCVMLKTAATELTDDGRTRVAGETETIIARHVVGADGANSFVRDALAIARVDGGIGERWLVCDMKILQAMEFDPNIGQICDPARPRMLMPLGKTHRRFEWMLLPGESTEEFERPEVAWSLLREYGVTPQTHEIARQIVYTFQARMATSWRSGRVFLLGDAAHTMPPFAGQGLLSALRDASNLAWKLQFVLTGLASELVLETYESERRPHVAAWTELSLAEGRVSCELDSQRAAERDARLFAGEKLDVHHAPMPGPGIFAARYKGESGLIGTLGPQGRVAVLSGIGRCDDLLRGTRFTILAIGASPQSLLSSAQLVWLRRLDALLAQVLPVSSAPAVDAIVDVDGSYFAYFAKHSIAAIIVRPDFNVFGACAALQDLPSLTDELQYLLTHGGASG